MSKMAQSKSLSAISDVPLEEHRKADNSEEENNTSSEANPKEQYTVLSEKEKVFYIFIASLVTLLGPVSSDIYYPALDLLSKDLNVSKTQMSLTITAFMVAQAVAPLLTASVSDMKGRRPVFVVCLTIYMVVSVALALQSSFPALITLRCLQSLGSSGVAGISSATTADVITRAERGRYLVYTSLGWTIGPAIGPIIGGILVQYLGWRSIFWFLTILGGVILVLILGFLQETCRVIVGDGSVPPPRWNQPVLALLRPKHRVSPNHQSLVTFRRRPGVFDSVRLVATKQFGFLILFSTFIMCGWNVILSCIPFLFESKYNFNALQVGLAYIPFAVGGLTARWTCGTWTDRNFKRHGRLAGVEIVRNQQSKHVLLKIPLEKARIEIILPMAFLWFVCLIAYSWLMQYDVHMSAPLVVMFFLGNATAGTSNVLSMLIIDLHSHQPATAMAALNIVRYGASAGAVAATIPLINAIGIGWTGTLFALIGLVSSPVLWIVYIHGHDWRRSKENTEQ
ncbi:MFS general substrate transporter [Aspergillus pseudonomiae]|uniref:Citrate exporter 1 n=1 Tax=Aspergillus pseudonomiae TaxID=1506151 RepID=A0A5N7CVM9_9EURO|nr:MFS general substrate transporter [Aspergillus pseudonomiae]KAE8397668.1 MFS general substrate transporter [Aspergillus pseudonomiae]